MNKNIKLAVAGAVLALSASAANAGIIIPAGEWTIDINGNVNTYANYTHYSTGSAAGLGALATPAGASNLNGEKAVGISTGLLPAWLGFTGKTRQNDLDVEFTISMQPQSSNNGVTGDGATGVSGANVVALGGAAQFLNRQTYVSFGDKSWGSIKLGKDLGVFASDAILADMTLLGVGGGAGASGNGNTNATLGGIGSGYIYAAWKGQIAYTTPNMSGFQATVAITNPDQGFSYSGVNQDRYGLEGKASYSFAQDAFSGKVWVSGASYDVTVDSTHSYTASAGDIGATVSSNGFGLTGYWYQGAGAGTTFFGNNGYTTTYGKRDSDGGYAQLTYVTPFKTKVGLAYGLSNLDRAVVADTTGVKSNERITAGLYHPLTKHLNLVAEYNNIKSDGQNGGSAELDTYSAGAILFF